MEETSTTKPSGPAIRQFSVMLHNRAGAMEALIKLLHNAGLKVLNEDELSR